MSFFNGPSLWPERDFHALLRLCGPQLWEVTNLSYSQPSHTCLNSVAGAAISPLSLAAILRPSCGHPAIDLSISAFRTLTHMDLWSQISADDAVICLGLAVLPCLTHLCLNMNNFLYWHVLVPRILAQCLHLQVLVSMMHALPAKSLASNPPTTDVRFVSIVCPHRKDWEVGARGGIDFWAAADNFVARKRQGELEASCFLKADLNVACWRKLSELVADVEILDDEIISRRN
ncbi:hypothetical protein K438DRAFT_1880572 [Mycena galopus ATCC 62051]|nr:hypothetical protein K438DRAFT_1880572 [Mycena galopus ATCC 62051]